MKVKKGFTIAEIIVTIVLLFIIFNATIAMFTSPKPANLNKSTSAVDYDFTKTDTQNFNTNNCSSITIKMDGNRVNVECNN